MSAGVRRTSRAPWFATLWPQLSLLWCWNMLSSSFIRTDASQTGSWHLSFQSAKEGPTQLSRYSCVYEVDSSKSHTWTQNSAKDICSDLLAHCEADREAFLSQTVTDDEIWIHHFKSETKMQSMEWHHPTSPQNKKLKAIPSAGKLMITVFWDCEGMILVNVLPRQQGSKW